MAQAGRSDNHFDGICASASTIQIGMERNHNQKAMGMSTRQIRPGPVDSAMVPKREKQFHNQTMASKNVPNEAESFGHNSSVPFECTVPSPLQNTSHGHILN